MPNTYAVHDVYQLMNKIVSEATGRTDLSVVDTSSFTSVGETVLRTSAESTLSAISNVIAKTIFSVRPYKGSLDILRVGQQRWGSQIRKIVNLYDEAEESEDWNTVGNANQLADGNTVDHYKIRKPKVVQLNFYGTKVLQKHITRFRDQLATAFHSEAEFMQFIDSVMTEFFNEVELLNENESRLTLLNYMAGISSMGLTEVDLVAEYNTEFGTQLTRDQLLDGDHLTSFLQFIVATIRTYSDRMTDLTTLYHANLTGYAPIMRHTPKEKQKLVLISQILRKAEAQVYSTIFNPERLEELGVGQLTTVNFWQSANDPYSIHVKPNILDVATGASKNAETEVELDYVLGVLFDEEACGVMPQFDYASTTPFNSAGGYYNLYYHWRFNSYVDYTSNGVLFVLGEGGE